ncbi:MULTISPECIES: AGE family epimerase/isomerase [unclassified Marinovum]
MTKTQPLASETPGPFWLEDDTHRRWLAQDALRQLEFFRASARPEGGFYILGHDGAPMAGEVQELHTTTRLVHSFTLGKLAGGAECDAIIDHGMAYLKSHHHDKDHGGYLWARDGDAVHDGRKLAYGHVFTLLAGASAKMAGHPDADALIEDVSAVLDQHFWEEERGLFADEWNRDWTPFSTYRGMNANMHSVEALLTAFEATDREVYLDRAGRILTFFLGQIAPAFDWRLPEHYTADWQVDRGYSSNPMFRPAGTTPGHSFELARLLLQHWDLSGRKDATAPETARRVMEQALSDAWDQTRGGFVYTLDFDGTPAIEDRYWWPVTEAIGVLAAFIKLERNPADEVWYRRLWQFADAHFVDHDRGGWFHEIDAEGKPTEWQFPGKGDIYHALQAELFPLAPGLSNLARALPDING